MSTTSRVGKIGLTINKTQRRFSDAYHKAPFMEKRVFAATIGGSAAFIGAILISFYALRLPKSQFVELFPWHTALQSLGHWLSNKQIDRPIDRLTERIQLFTLVFGFFFTLIAYRFYSYHRRSVTDNERDAELLILHDGTLSWKRVKHPFLWWSSVLVSVLIRAGIAFVVVFVINFFWGVLLLPVNLPNAPQVGGVQTGVLPEMLQYWVMGIYGMLFGFALVYMLVGIDDNEHAIGHFVFATSGFVILTVVANNQLKLSNIHLGITNVLEYAGFIQAKIVQLVDKPFLDALHLHLAIPSPSVYPLFGLLIPANPMAPGSISAYGTITQTATLFTLLIIVLGIFTLTLARDAVNDWWWLQEIKPELGLHLRKCGLGLLRWLITLLLIFDSLVAIFPTEVGHFSTNVSRIHALGGFGSGGMLFALMLCIPLFIPDPYGRRLWLNLLPASLYSRLLQHPKPPPMRDVDYRTKWFVLLSLILFLASAIITIIIIFYVWLKNHNGQWVFFVEIIILPTGGIWMYLFNWYSKHHIRNLPKEETTRHDPRKEFTSDIDE